MRVTQRSLQDGWLQNVQERLGSIDRWNKQIGSGLKVQKPGDDPSGANRIVRIQDVTARYEQYLKNIGEAESVQQATESALAQAYQRLVQAKSLALEGANDSSVSQSGSFQALAEEVAGIRLGIFQIASNQKEGKYLFSGTATDIAPFSQEGGSYRGDSNWTRINTGNGQTVAVNLPGDVAFRETEVRGTVPVPLDATGGFVPASDLAFTVSDGTVDVQVSLTSGTSYDLAGTLNSAFQAAGANLRADMTADGALSIRLVESQRGGEMALKDTSGGLEETLGIQSGVKNVFGVLDELEAALRSEDPARVSKLLGRIDRSLDALVAQRGLLGARMRNLQTAREGLEEYSASSDSLRASIEGVDTAQAVTRLSAEEQAYQTALAAGARILNLSLLDYLS